MSYSIQLPMLQKMFSKHQSGVDAILPRSLPPLPLDVLIGIGTFSDNHEVSLLMRTCRVLHHEGAKILLRRGPWLSDLKRVTSFVEFLRAEEGSRCQHLYSLTVMFPRLYHPLPNEVGQPLAELFRSHSFRSLTRLYLDGADLMFEHTPDLIPAFAAVQTLQQILLEGCEHLSPTFLTALKSKPALVALTYTTSFDEESSTARNDSHPIVALQSVRDSLRRLFVTEFASPLDGGLALEPFLKLTTLDLDRTEYPVLGPYIRYCPNLKRLNVTTFYNDTMEEDDVDMRTLDDLRSVNVEYQLQHGTWSSLEAVSGGVYDIYLAALLCPIGRLSMRICDYDLYDPVLPILSAAKVSSLALWSASHCVFDDDDGLPSVLRGLREASPSLQELSLDIHIPRSTEDLHSALQRTLDPVALLSIREFTLTLYLNETPELRGSLVDRFLANFDFSERAREVLSASTTLKAVEMGMYKHLTRGTVTAQAVRE